MATCSIFDKIVINNPKFLEEYLEHMEAVDGSYEWKRRTNDNIKIATSEDCARFWKHYKERKAVTK